MGSTTRSSLRSPAGEGSGVRANGAENLAQQKLDVPRDFAPQRWMGRFSGGRLNFQVPMNKEQAMPNDLAGSQSTMVVSDSHDSWPWAPRLGL
jgi:hypothetical protein